MSTSKSTKRRVDSNGNVTVESVATVVARICGVGCDYNIVRDDNDETFAVVVFGGPVRRTMLEKVQWLEAMQFVANDVENDLCENIPARINDAELTITQK
jgi:hypothetical protein